MKAGSNQVNVLVVIDTERIKLRYGKGGTQLKPLNIDNSNQYMIAYAPRGIVSGEATGDLFFMANVGDGVSFRGTSIDQNSDDAAIVYGISYWKGKDVFNRFSSNGIVLSGAVQPDESQPNGLPPVHKSQDFHSLDALVVSAGIDYFWVDVAIYTMGTDGNTQEIYGYYSWSSEVKVIG